MTSRWWFIILLAFVGAAPASQAQGWPAAAGKAPRTSTDPRSLLGWWFLGAKQVTHDIPSDYKVGGLYRLRQDVVVECGGTSSRVSEYWICARDPGQVERVKEELRDPQGTKEQEIRALRSATASLNFKSDGVRDGLLNAEIRRIHARRESRSILSAGMRLRFQQIWMQRSFEMGQMLRPYAEVLDGPLQGKWVDISSLSDCETLDDETHRQHCNFNPGFLECLDTPAHPGDR